MNEVITISVKIGDVIEKNGRSVYSEEFGKKLASYTYTNMYVVTPLCEVVPAELVFDNERQAYRLKDENAIITTEPLLYEEIIFVNSWRNKPNK